jgi:hypothetical protein
MTADGLRTVEVLAHRALSHGGRVYLAGERLDLPNDEAEALESTRIVNVIPTAEEIAEVERIRAERRAQTARSGRSRKASA